MIRFSKSKSGKKFRRFDSELLKIITVSFEFSTKVEFEQMNLSTNLSAYEAQIFDSISTDTEISITESEFKSAFDEATRIFKNDQHERTSVNHPSHHC